MATIEDDDEPCRICKKPILAGQQHYAGLDHWDCRYPNGRNEDDELKSSIAGLKAGIDKLKRLIK